MAIRQVLTGVDAALKGMVARTPRDRLAAETLAQTARADELIRDRARREVTAVTAGLTPGEEHTPGDLAGCPRCESEARRILVAVRDAAARAGMASRELAAPGLERATEIVAEVRAALAQAELDDAAAQAAVPGPEAARQLRAEAHSSGAQRARTIPAIAVTAAIGIVAGGADAILLWSTTEATFSGGGDVFTDLWLPATVTVIGVLGPACLLAVALASGLAQAVEEHAGLRLGGVGELLLRALALVGAVMLTSWTATFRSGPLSEGGIPGLAPLLTAGSLLLAATSAVCLHRVHVLVTHAAEHAQAQRQSLDAVSVPARLARQATGRLQRRRSELNAEIERQRGLLQRQERDALKSIEPFLTASASDLAHVLASHQLGLCHTGDPDADAATGPGDDSVAE